MGILIAIVTISRSGNIVATSGPWWEGTETGSKETESTMPLGTSGSTARLAITDVTLEISWALSIEPKTLLSPVVLQETTRTTFLPLDFS